MTAVFYPSSADGTVEAPPSKSMAHRALIASALTDGQSFVENLAPSEDVLATIDCLRALGARVDLHDSGAVVDGCSLRDAADGAVLPCRESGSTLRFLIPLALTTDKEIAFTGSSRLFERPLDVFEDICLAQGLLFRQGNGCLTVKGRLAPGQYPVPGGVSSQFITGLCFALPLLDGDSRIEILPPAVSSSYVDMTLQILSLYGIRITREGNCLTIPGNQRYVSHAYRVEGDWTNAAYLEALGFADCGVRVTGLDGGSMQGDRIYPALFEELRQDAPVLNLADNPDLGPVLFALASAWHGGVFTGVGRLRDKESDRIAAMVEELGKFGARLKIGADTVTVLPSPLHAPDAELWGHSDHRIVMALTVLAAFWGGRIRGAEAVGKSFPGYFDALGRLGIRHSLTEEM